MAKDDNKEGTMARTLYNWTDEQHDRWLEELGDRYGFRPMYSNSLYIDPRTGVVYCESEFIAKADRNDPGDPELATDWTQGICAADGYFGSIR